jgi:hypothetical protein
MPRQEKINANFMASAIHDSTQTIRLLLRVLKRNFLYYKLTPLSLSLCARSQSGISDILYALAQLFTFWIRMAL